MKEDKCFNAWRRSEAYQLPMTDEGIKRAGERYEQFKVGWDYAIKSCMLELEREHREVKKTHSFFNIAKDIISNMRIHK